VDEAGWLFQVPTGTTWAPTEKTLILHRGKIRRELSTVIGLTITGQIYKRHFRRSVGVRKWLRRYATSIGRIR